MKRADPLGKALASDAEERGLDFRSFAKAAWNVVEPGTELKWNWHHALIAEHLMEVKAGRMPRLIINIPPRNMKSILTTVCFPAWVWATAPEARFICVSYGQTLATKHSVDRRQLIESQWYQDRWGSKFAMAPDQNMKTQFLNSERGHMIATSMTGSATGLGADYLLIDDPHNVKRADSDLNRQTDIDAFDKTFLSRLDNKKTGRIIVIMQRLHDQDLTGHLLTQGGWEHLKIPAIAPVQKFYTFPVSKRVKETKPGEIMHPEREGKEELAKLKLGQGSRTFAGQYLQEPAPAEGNIIKREWIRFYRELPSRLDRQVQSWDMSFKGSTGSDYVCGGVWARAEGNYYLVDLIRDRMDFPTTQTAVASFSAKHPKAYRKLIEEKANGSAIMDSLRHKIGGFIAINPDRSKEARLNGVAPMWEAGNVWLPDPMIAPWISDYIEELVKFPSGAHDDQVDMTSQALDDLRVAHIDRKAEPVQSKKTTIAPSRGMTSW